MTETDLPLKGLRVLDLSRALSGPFCSMILADLGAEVYKIEPTPDGDFSRSWSPFDRSEGIYYLSTNHNKRSLAVDFRSLGGLQLLHELALKSDIIVENFRPGTMAAMGMDPQALLQEKPNLIIASISAFGSSGPLSQRPGFDQIAQGYSGFMSFTGDGAPTRVGVAIGDLTSGMWLSIGVLSALIARNRDGKGQIVETSLFASLVALLSVQGQRYLSLGEIAEPTGNVHPVIAPYGVFRAKDGNLNIGAATQKMWLRLCDVLELPELKDDPRFTDNAKRVASREELRKLLECRLVDKTRAEWTNVLVPAGIPAGPINNVADAFAEEQLNFCRLVEEIKHPILGLLKQVGVPLVFSGKDSNRIRRPPPLYAEHSREILSEFGYEQGHIDQFLHDGVISQRTD